MQCFHHVGRLDSRLPVNSTQWDKVVTFNVCNASTLTPEKRCVAPARADRYIHSLGLSQTEMKQRRSLRAIAEIGADLVEAEDGLCSGCVEVTPAPMLVRAGWPATTWSRIQWFSLTIRFA